MRNPLIALALLAGAATSANAAVVVQQPGKDMLLAALSDVQFEDFEDAVLLDGLSVSGTGAISGGVLYRQIRADRPSVFTFAEPIFGFGGDIRSSGFGQLAITLTFEDGSQQQLAPYDISPTKSFLGFTSDVGITSINVRSGTAGTVQYYLDDLSFGSAAAVPEPAQWAMLIVGFGMIGSGLRRRRTMETHLA